MFNGDRARGALIGLAVGDALGATTEFTKPTTPKFPTLLSGPVATVIGGGVLGVSAGQVTDDTQMACCLYASIRERGKFDAADVAHRYVEWMARAFDIGIQTSAALSLMRAGEEPLLAAKRVWATATGRRPAGNGSLMRTAPIAVLLGHDVSAVRVASLQDSALTHFDPLCQIACAAFNVALRSAVYAEGNAAQMHGGAAAEVKELADADLGCDTALTHAAAEDLLEDLRLATLDDPDLFGAVHLHAHQGFVRVAFRLAFWELLHAPSYRAALVDVVNRGGDADTNGAICGALCGAAFGESQIPDEWRSTVLAAPALAGDARYHPQIFLDAGTRDRED